MNSILNLGKYIYAIPFAIFGLMHLASGPQMAGMVPIPGGAIWVYITGIGLLAASVSILIGKYDKLGAALLGLMLLIFALSIHLPGVMGENAMSSMPNLLKDLGLAGAAWMYAGSLAKDNSVIGGGTTITSPNRRTK